MKPQFLGDYQEVSLATLPPSWALFACCLSRPGIHPSSKALYPAGQGRQHLIRKLHTNFPAAGNKNSDVHSSFSCVPSTTGLISTSTSEPPFLGHRASLVKGSSQLTLKNSLLLGLSHIPTLAKVFPKAMCGIFGSWFLLHSSSG